MNRSGYCNYYSSQWQDIIWRGAVVSAIKGKRGQAFLKETLAALDALPERKLIADNLVTAGGQVCVLGAVAKRRSIDVSRIDPEDYSAVADKFGIAEALAREIEYINDKRAYPTESPEQRYERVRKWVEGQIRNGTQ